jgi:hypothetical protein
MICMAHGDTYDYVPDAHAKYPFIWLDSELQDEGGSKDLIGTVTQQMRIYGRLTDRNKIDSLTTLIRNDLVNARDAFDYSIRLTGFEIDPIKENDNGTPLLHYSVMATFQYNKKER